MSVDGFQSNDVTDVPTYSWTKTKRLLRIRSGEYDPGKYSPTTSLTKNRSRGRKTLLDIHTRAYASSALAEDATGRERMKNGSNFCE